jgi:hypothetical protein
MLLRYKETVPTFVCEKWEGDNFELFSRFFDHASSYGGILEISEWRQESKSFHDHRILIGQWVVYNELTERIEIIDEDKFQKRFELLD